MTVNTQPMLQRQQIESSLGLILCPDAETRRKGEEYLESCFSCSGFGSSLMAIGLDSMVDVGKRQLAFVVLKKLVKHQWLSETISAEEKSHIRSLIPSGLKENSSPIQTATGLVIAEIARSESFADWPELMPGLVSVIQGNEDHVFVRGALRALCLMIEDLDQGHVIEVAKVVMPNIMQLCQSQTTLPAEKRQGLTILHTTIDSVEYMYRSSSDAKDLMRHQIGSWFQTCALVLDCPVDVHNGDVLGTAFMALQCATRLIPLSSKVSDQSCVLNLIRSVWNFNGQVRVLFQQYVIGDGIADSLSSADQGPMMEPVTLVDVVSQLLEFLTAALTSNSLKKVCQSSLPDVVNVTLHYMTIAYDDIDDWVEDCNEYLSSGDDFWGCRSSGGLLLDSIVESYGGVGMEAVEQGIQDRIEAGKAAASSQDPIYWRLVESALIALSDLADVILERPSVVRKEASCTNPNYMLQWLLKSPEYNSPTNALLLARILSYASRYTPALSKETRELVLQNIGQYIAIPGLKPAVYGGIFQALEALVKTSTSAEIAPVSNHFMGYLCSMLPSATDETMHLIFENIEQVVKKDPSCVHSWADRIIPVAMRAWIDNYNDPLLGEDAFTLLQNLAQCPGGFQHMVTTAVPTLKAMVESNTAPPMLESGAFDLVVEITSSASAQDAKPIFIDFMPLALQRLQSTADEDVMASISAFFRTILQIGQSDALTWFSSSRDESIGTFIQLIQFLLRPETPDRAARYVGGVILSLFSAVSLDTIGQEHLTSILSMVAQKLHTAEDPSTVQSLLSVLATLSRIDTDALINILSSIGGSPAVLQSVMDKWIERHIEIRTPYDIKLSIVALSAILTSNLSILDQISVRGQRIDTSSSIRTRSRAATRKEEWSMVPLRTKIALVLLDSYIESVTQGNAPGVDDEDEWIEDDDEDDEDDYDGIEQEDDFGIDSAIGQYSMYGELLEDLDTTVLADVDQLELKRRASDPLLSLNVVEYLPGIIKSFQQAHPQAYDGFCHLCSPIQRTYIPKLAE